MACSTGIQFATFAAKYTGLAITTHPHGLCLGAIVGTLFMPGIAASAKLAIVGAVFSSSLLLAWVSVPFIGGLIGLSVLMPADLGAKYRTFALILGFGHLVLTAGIAATFLSAAGTGVGFAATLVCMLAGTGVMMLGAGLLTAFVANVFCDLIDGPMNREGTPGFSTQLWQSS